MYCLRLFVVVLHYLLHFLLLLLSLKSMCVPGFIVIGYCVSELHGHTCPYRKVLPEAFVLQELHCLPNYLHICVIKVRGCYHITKFCCSIPYGF